MSRMNMILFTVFIFDIYKRKVTNVPVMIQLLLILLLNLLKVIHCHLHVINLIFLITLIRFIITHAFFLPIHLIY